jgi:NAD-dependent oxidoreductase involved in siderophore biosynthesis
MDDAQPLFVLVLGAALGVVTLAALRPALRQSRRGLFAVVGSRALSSLLGVPVYFAAEAPGWAEVATSVSIVFTVLGVALLVPALRQHDVPSVA